MERSRVSGEIEWKREKICQKEDLERLESHFEKKKQNNEQNHGEMKVFVYLTCSA